MNWKTVINNQYSLSFTTGAALEAETVAIAKLKSNLVDWKDVRADVIEKNTLQARTESTLKKLYGEISRRLKHLSDQELALLISSDEKVQKQIIWLAICRHYKFISDFAKEVLYEYFENSRYQISLDDYDVYFNSKAEWNENLDGVSSLTKSKARQVLFKMMRECQITNDNKEILPQQLNNELRASILKGDADEIKLFPGEEGF